MTNATAEDDRTRGRLGRPGLPRRCASLGIDVAADRVSIVATSKGNFGLEIARAADAPTLESPLRALETLLRSLAKEERIVERRCVVAIRPGAAEIAYKAFPRKFPPSEIAAAAKTLMNGAAAFSRERIVRTIKLSTVEPDGNVHYGIVAANRAQVDEAALLPRRLNLRPIVDVPALAWMRVVEAGVLVDAAIPYLAVHGRAVPIERLLGAHSSPYDAANAARGRLTQLREAHDFLERSLRYVGSYPSERFYAYRSTLEQIGIMLEPLVIEQQTCPPWAFAYALATWDA